MGMFHSSWLRRCDDPALPTVVQGPNDDRAVSVALNLLPPGQALASDRVWVIYASETGVAEHLARDTFRVMQDAGVASRLLPFDELELARLQTIDCALFLASTCYDGDPPDMAEEFCRKHMSEPTRLPRLRYGMLALGDSYYDEFCGFGRQLHQWLQASGAHSLFDPVEMDDEDEAAARRWHGNLRLLIQVRRAGGSPVA